jgi:hypothetical protein
MKIAGRISATGQSRRRRFHPAPHTRICRCVRARLPVSAQRRAARLARRLHTVPGTTWRCPCPYNSGGRYGNLRAARHRGADLVVPQL